MIILLYAIATVFLSTGLGLLVSGRAKVRGIPARPSTPDTARRSRSPRRRRGSSSRGSRLAGAVIIGALAAGVISVLPTAAEPAHAKPLCGPSGISFTPGPVGPAGVAAQIGGADCGINDLPGKSSNVNLELFGGNKPNNQTHQNLIKKDLTKVKVPVNGTTLLHGATQFAHQEKVDQYKTQAAAATSGCKLNPNTSGCTTTVQYGTSVLPATVPSFVPTTSNVKVTTTGKTTTTTTSHKTTGQKTTGTTGPGTCQPKQHCGPTPKDFCAQHPNAPICGSKPDWCTKHPNDPTCQPKINWCAKHPKDLACLPEKKPTGPQLPKNPPKCPPDDPICQQVPKGNDCKLTAEQQQALVEQTAKDQLAAVELYQQLLLKAIIEQAATKSSGVLLDQLLTGRTGLSPQDVADLVKDGTLNPSDLAAAAAQAAQEFVDHADNPQDTGTTCTDKDRPGTLGNSGIFAHSTGGGAPQNPGTGRVTKPVVGLWNSISLRDRVGQWFFNDLGGVTEPHPGVWHIETEVVDTVTGKFGHVVRELDTTGQVPVFIMESAFLDKITAPHWVPTGVDLQPNRIGVPLEL